MTITTRHFCSSKKLVNKTGPPPAATTAVRRYNYTCI